MTPQPLPIRFLLYRGALAPGRCAAEVATAKGFRQCAARWVDVRLGAPLCGRHVKWIAGRKREAAG